MLYMVKELKEKCNLSIVKVKENVINKNKNAKN